ncbi:ABC transporter ATP-binding protein [Streptomyces sp. NPDC004284]|uniref:ABC transporter ATP-binding protein n=1 Tax=Streptomyces sp. NPDC004284 TaxID=3364695 RepID=UPI00368B30D3
MIVASGLTKRFGRVNALDEVTFEVCPGVVTGFLGPNGAGKSTTLRILLGLVAPTSGSSTIDGVPYREMRRPLHRVGALLDATSVPGGRSGLSHLTALARSNGIGRARVLRVLEEAGLGPAARRRIGGYSLGMKQRLGIAAALLGDPPVVIFDEPANGLDPEGIRWIRSTFRSLAAEGRTVLVSSHLMSEMESTADHLLVIDRGRVVADASLSDLVGPDARSSVLVRTPHASGLREAVERAGGAVAPGPDDTVRVSGLTAGEIGDLAFAGRIRLHELTPRRGSLEERFMSLISGSDGPEHEPDPEDPVTS